MRTLRQWASHLLCRYPRGFARLLSLFGRLDAERLTFLSIIRAGDCVWDVGANLGYYTELFAEICGPRGRVIAVEPIPETCRQLRERLARSGIRTVEVFQCAVSNVEHAGEMIMPGRDHGQASLRMHAEGSWRTGSSATIPVVVTTLDRLLESGLRAPTFVKLDVEGAELPALQGARRLLEQHRPVLHLEYFAPWTEAFGYNRNDLISWLRQCGYDVFVLPTLSGEPMRQPEDTMADLSSSENLLCAGSDVHRDALRRFASAGRRLRPRG